MEQLSLMQQFADPVLIRELSAAQLLAGSFITTLMGIGITFSVLTLLMAFVTLFTRVLKSGNKLIEKAEATETGGARPELYIALTAAIAAYEGSGTEESRIPRETRKAAGERSNWINICTPKGIDIKSNLY